MFTKLASWLTVVIVAFAGVAEATLVDTTNPADVTAFQAGLTVNNFESVAGTTAFGITTYDSGVAVPSTAFVFNQIPGVQFSVGGQVGTNRPALYSLGGTIAGDAQSPSTVLGTVDFDGNTLLAFSNNNSVSGLIEIFFPTKVSSVAFWLDPSLSNVSIIAADTNFAFSGLTETTLESYSNLTAGHFIGITRPTADIGGFKIQSATSLAGFAIDDFTYGGGTPTATTPEPATLVLLGSGLVALGVAQYRRRR
jgi:PEP-CTERM motif-containing protein